MTSGLRRWLPALAWSALIFAVSAQPRLPVALESGTDKIAHFLAYAILGLALAFARAGSRLPILAVIAIGVLYGASDEWHQSFVSGRSSDIFDWLADSAGVIAGVVAYTLFRRSDSDAFRPTPVSPRSSST